MLDELSLNDFVCPVVDLPETVAPSISPKTLSSPASEITCLVNRCGSLSKLVNAMSLVLSVARRWVSVIKCKLGIPFCSPPPCFQEALNLISTDTQNCYFPSMLLDINSYSGNLACLSPFIDATGIIRVGGRLSQSNLNYEHKYPILLPNKSILTSLIVAHYHAKARHQGRCTCITVSAIRDAGFFIHCASSTIRKFISNCVICKKLCRPLESQRMNDLPPISVLNVHHLSPTLV